MKNKKRILSSFLFLLACAQLHAQEKDVQLHIGYLAPYITQIGGEVGVDFELKRWGASVSSDQQKIYKLSFMARIGYFKQQKVAESVFFNPELVLRSTRAKKRFYTMVSLSPAYLRSFQRQEGALDLATGATDYRTAAIGYFVPNINLGLGLAPKQNIGYYVKTTYGRKINATTEGSAFFGASLGITVNLKSKG